MLAYLSEVSLLMADPKNPSLKKVYMKALVLFFHTPILTITAAMLWLLTSVLIIKSPIIGFFIMPGLTCDILVKVYRSLLEKNKIKLFN